MGLKKTPVISQNESASEGLDLLLSPKQFFFEKLKISFQKRNFHCDPFVQNYLANLLEHYMDARNLFENSTTLAEMYLQANQSDYPLRVDMLKKLGDKALYVSGFFSDSLQRKVVDVDYYAEMGGAAYGSLAHYVKEDSFSKIYRLFSSRFLDFVEILNYISHDSGMQSNQNILRLYDTYIRTGSEVAREKLVEMGVVTIPKTQAKLVKQD